MYKSIAQNINDKDYESIDWKDPLASNLIMKLFFLPTIYLLRHIGHKST